ncbi:MAG TPA: NAD(P)/FAD-dependent oxidoreductase [Polyangiaceae bacterium]|nr:NAD(P)/FAD-dependent oxidoreductase [Polyangiaceae bacterium]
MTELNRALDIGVVGAGTAGAAAAILLARAGHRVSLFEAVPDPKPVGAGIMMQPSGMSVLDEIGLLPAIIARGARISGLQCATEQGRPVMRVDYARLSPTAFGVGLHRGVLFDQLFDQAGVEPNVALHLGTPVTRYALEKRVDQARPTLYTATGERHELDLLVVANGARSELRSQSGLTLRDTPYPWGALWLVVKDEGRIFGDRLSQFVAGTKEMLGFLPTGLGPTGETPLVSIFWSIEAHRVDEFRRANIEVWKRRVRQLAPQCAALLEQVRDPAELLFAGYRDVVMRPWHRSEGVVFLGDAAHATSPQLGQGANLALVDARALRDALGNAATLSEALAQYSRSRRHELAYYQWATRMLTPFFQSNASLLGWLRDRFMHSTCRVPFAARKMTRTLCGLERGVVFSRALPLPALPSAELGAGPALKSLPAAGGAAALSNSQ